MPHVSALDAHHNQSCASSTKPRGIGGESCCCRGVHIQAQIFFFQELLKLGATLQCRLGYSIFLNPFGTPLAHWDACLGALTYFITCFLDDVEGSLRRKSQEISAHSYRSTLWSTLRSLHNNSSPTAREPLVATSPYVLQSWKGKKKSCAIH